MISFKSNCFFINYFRVNWFFGNVSDFELDQF